MKKGQILSIQSGSSITLGDPDATDAMLKPWTSAIYKQPLSGSILIDKHGLPGDEHVYESHGGPDKAILVSSAQHYPFWEELYGLKAMPFGGFGENFTSDGMLEIDVCIGDIYRIGTLLVQVTQPRPPCWKLSRRFGVIELSAKMEETCRTGFYFKVLEEGQCQTGDSFDLQEQPAQEWSVARVYHIYQDIRPYLQEARFLSTFHYLAPAMRSDFERYVKMGTTAKKDGRLIGPNR